MQTMWLLGGIGLGAGLMYVLDPQQGEARRDVVRGYAVDYRRQTGDYLDDTRRSLGRQAQAALATTRRPFQRQPGLGERLLAHAEQLGTTTGMVLVGCVGLGVGLGYLWACQGSAQQLPAFSANNPPAHARETGQKSSPGAGVRADGGGRSAR